MARLRIAMRRDLGVADMMTPQLTGALVAELRVKATPARATDRFQ
jgi:hypothetical protein